MSAVIDPVRPAAQPHATVKPDMPAAARTSEESMRKATTETLLTPRFYTTDYAALDRLDVGPVRAEWDAMMAEYEGDNNHDHFTRDAAFEVELKENFSRISPELRKEFIDFLVSSVTSEFSGCILYNEIQKNIRNPDIKGLMRYMARDESRHAGFINQSLKDFGIGLDRHKLDDRGAGGRLDPGGVGCCRHRGSQRREAEQASQRKRLHAPLGEAAGIEAMYAISRPHGGADRLPPAQKANQVGISSPRGVCSGTSCPGNAMKR